jgi:hypothetical protein
VSTDTDTGTRAREDTRRELLEDGDHERFAHIIRKKDELRGYVQGKPVVALCGKRWVPSRDPQKFPVCPTCQEVLAALRR